MATISFTVDTTDREALLAISVMLDNLAGDLSLEKKPTEAAALPAPVTAGPLPIEEAVGEAPELLPSPEADPMTTDSRGYTWDERIHTSTRSKNKDGSWRYRPRVDKELIAEVESAQEESMNETLAAGPAPETAPAIESFPELMVWITTNRPDKELINQACRDNGVESIQLLGATPEKIPAVAKTLQELAA